MNFAVLRLRSAAILPIALVFLLDAIASVASCATAGPPSANPLSIVEGGHANAVIILSPDAGQHETQAAEDLQKYIRLMTGVAPRISRREKENASLLADKGPLLIVGAAALSVKPQLMGRLSPLLKTEQFVRSDGIILSREGNRVYLAGSNDESHYFAVAELLKAWGVRWFMPGDFGEYIPKEEKLEIGALNFFYAPPFEIRSAWISWLGDKNNFDEFLLRNTMISTNSFPMIGHNLGQYTKSLGSNPFTVPISDPHTADIVAAEVEDLYASDKTISLAMEDGVYASTYPRDLQLNALQWDKYSFRYSVTDAMLELLNGVAKRLRERHPLSKSKIGFFAYSNMFLPPKHEVTLDPALFGMIAPIDIDPIHGMDDPQSRSKQEYKSILQKWASLTRGRLIVYDYDQSMLVWRDLPNPSHQAFAHDVKVYRDAKVLGVATESRMALTTTFINLYLRGRLMWDPNADIERLLDDFYAKFFGPAREPMRDYWEAVFNAWEKTIATEHEYFVAPAIYTADLIERLNKSLTNAERIIASSRTTDEHYSQRLKYVRLGFEILQSYVEMVAAANTKLDYAAAVAAGERGLRAREELSQMNSAFTSTKLESGYAFFPGEVQQNSELLQHVNGERGRLLMPLPLEWSFHRDPDRSGLDKGYLDKPIDLTFWQAHHGDYDLDSRKDYPIDQWEMVRSDLYIQAQGIRRPDRQGFVGDLWYRTEVKFSSTELKTNPHILFPGLFNACELYVNGDKVAARDYLEPWYYNDYRFEWDVALGAGLKPGSNSIALRCYNPHHMGGMFRRPFIYSPISVEGK